MASKQTNETKDNRKRAFAWLVYPTERYVKEHYPDCEYDGADGWGTIDDDAWIGTLKGTMWKGFISPLHYKDKVEGENKIKKPHWHILIFFGTNAKKNWDTQIKPKVSEIFGQNGFTTKLDIQSVQGYARYLCHIDNPEKAQYNKNDVIAFGGSDYTMSINTTEDNARVQREIIGFIKDNNVLYFNNLVDWCMANNEEWYQFLTKNCYFIREYLKSKNAEMNGRLNEQTYVLTHEEVKEFEEYLKSKQN